MKKEAILSLFNPFGEQVVDDQRKSRYPYQNRRKNASYFKYRGISIFLLFEWGKSDKSSAYPCKKPEGEAKISLVEPYAVMLNAGFSAQELRKICKLVQEKREILKGAYHDYFA